VGDVSVDPLFVADEFGDVHLKAGSPCIDAGLDSVVQAGWTDLDGEIRSQGAHVDIGADEFNGTPPAVFAPTVIRVGPSGDDANDGSTWALAKLTVQAGIDGLGGHTGEVWVAAGTYHERITLKTGAYLYGGFAGSEDRRDQRDWTAHATILDGQLGGKVVTAERGGLIGCVDGLVIRNGVGTGGGVYCYYSSPRISNNTITSDPAQAADGIGCDRSMSPIVGNRILENAWAGIYGNRSVLAISGNTITQNHVAGIGCNYCSLWLSDNTISGNGHLDDGGVSCYKSALSIWRCVVSGNLGSGITCSAPSAPPVIANNLLQGNQAKTIGGGINCDGSPVITNNTIVGNSAPVNGGGIALTGIAQVRNNIVADNSSGIYGASAASVLSGNCVFNPAGANYTGVTPGAGDIALDPLFENTQAGDYHLAAGSPCIDAGKNADAVAAGPTVDLDGYARFMNDPATPDCPWAPGTCGTAPIVDIGAYEYIAGDFDHDGDLDAGDAAVFAACVSGPSVMYAGDCLKADFDRDGDVDLVDFGFFQRCFSGAGKAVDPGCTR
jgi:hypothetical protein